MLNQTKGYPHASICRRSFILGSPSFRYRGDNCLDARKMIAYTETIRRFVNNNGYAWPTGDGFHGYRLTRYGIVIYECYLVDIDKPMTTIQLVYGGKLIERTWRGELSQNQITRRVNQLIRDVTPKEPESTMNSAVVGLTSAISSLGSVIRKESK